MLGRYVAGTLLILGVAMVMAPSSPEPVSDGEPLEVTRAENSPGTLAPPKPAILPGPSIPAKSEAAEATDAVSSEGVEAAVLEALNLDIAEDAERPTTEPVDAGTETDVATAGEAIADDATEEPDLQRGGVLAGLSDPGFFTGITSVAEEELRSDPAQYLVVTGNRVNVRSGPSTDYRVVGSVVRGDPVELVTFQDDGWAQIRINDGEQTGFMASRFLSQGPNDG